MGLKQMKSKGEEEEEIYKEHFRTQSEKWIQTANEDNKIIDSLKNVVTERKKESVQLRSNNEAIQKDLDRERINLASLQNRLSGTRFRRFITKIFGI